MKGVFLAIEGPDGCGKTTQIGLLKERLEKAGYGVLVTREPGGTALGEQIRSLLLQPREDEICPAAELLLFEAARAQHVDLVIRPALEKGLVVLASRYAAATVAYQHGGRGLSLETVEKANDFGSQGLYPDLTIILDIESEKGLLRARGASGKDVPAGKLDRIESAGLEFHRQVRQGYLDLAAREPEKFCVISADQPIEVVAEKVAECVMEALCHA